MILIRRHVLSLGVLLLIGSFNLSPLSWKTRKQDVVSLSFAEANIHAMASIVCEILLLREVLLYLGILCTTSIVIYSDSSSSINLASIPVYHAHIKHIENDYHFICDDIIRGITVTKHVSTKSLLTDIMAKALGCQEFEHFLLCL